MRVFNALITSFNALKIAINERRRKNEKKLRERRIILQDCISKFEFLLSVEHSI